MQVTLYSREGCHLCEEALEVVRAECTAAGVPWQVVDIADDPVLQQRYAELIPVVLVDGREVGHWRIEVSALRRALRPRWWQRGAARSRR
ncbi:glutaredoxin family protein [Calidifontibacter sp. DB0510]|uniref:Glutaredoxin family protein n=1 Tax=Metallococcus carri TaxID=1656884 RepID=A0A967EGN7_9MICO|nr:glutaredoxin family protein [Metallococcus carri]NHN55323.1 glutaredoxin family protein [Metallococcus carri]NOP36400.1 glutaredoxin family protein [Calidifontibacter sp. DB2511S]